jgi:N-methylhydantoinase B
LPARSVDFADVLHDADGRPAHIRLSLTKRGERLTCDFRATDRRAESALNATRAVTLSAVFYCLRTLLPPGTPTNDGILRPVRVLTRPGTLVDASYPSGVAAGNVETSQRLVDVLYGALAELLPARIPAASAGTMSNLTFAATRPDESSFTYYETIPGGAGAGPRADGASGLQTHMTNTRNTPIEAFELAYPVRFERLALRRGSGGRGLRSGGEGLEKVLRFLVPSQAAFVGDRQAAGPFGLAAGGRGAPGRLELRRAGERTWRRLAAQWSGALPAGASLRIRTPGGGGHGRPRR